MNKYIASFFSILETFPMHTIKDFCLGTIHKRRLLLGGGRGVRKIENRGDFQGLDGETGGGRGSKILKNEETSFMDDPLHQSSLYKIKIGLYHEVVK